MRPFTKVQLSMLLALSIALGTPRDLRAEQTLSLKVSGMVCSFCAQGIRKNFERLQGVEAVEVNLDEHRVELKLKERNTLEEEQIRNILERSGYNLVEIKDSSAVPEPQS